MNNNKNKKLITIVLMSLLVVSLLASSLVGLTAG
jgi:flagellar basal body-associated protein FliL